MNKKNSKTINVNKRNRTEGFSFSDLGETSEEPPFSESEFENDYTQWSKLGNKYIPTRETVSELVPGLYEINMPNDEVVFERVEINNERLVRFPDSSFEEVINEIKTFWNREELFRSYEISFKRGILLYGKPGTGKSSLLSLIMEDVIDRGGIVVKFENSWIYKKAMRKLRQIQPDIPVVTIMEDLDSLMDNHNRSEILNILDGVSGVDKVVYLATTNYVEKLEERIVNRPSRFDKRVEIGYLNAKSRRVYFEFLFQRVREVGKFDMESVDVEKWVKDTKNLTTSHLHELFVGVVILGKDYNKIIKEIKAMESKLKTKAGKKEAGFSL